MLGAARGAYGWCVWLARYEVQVRLVVHMLGAVQGAGTTACLVRFVVWFGASYD